MNYKGVITLTDLERRLLRLDQRSRLLDRLFLLALCGWLTFLWWGTRQALQGGQGGKESFVEHGLSGSHEGRIP